MNEIEGCRRWAIGCGLAAMILMGGFYLWVFRSESGGPGGTGSDAPAAADGPVAEVDALLSDDKPDEALAACRKLAAEGTTPEIKEKAEDRLPECLKLVFARRIREKKYAEAEAISRELTASFPSSTQAPYVAHEFRTERRRWLKTAVEQDDVPLAERLFDEVGKDEQWQHDHSLQVDFQKYLAKRWHSAMDAGDVARAEKLFGDLALDAVRREWDGVRKEREAYLLARFSTARTAHDAAQADRFFTELRAVTKERGAAFDWSAHVPYLEERVRALCDRGDYAAAHDLFEAIQKEAFGAAWDKLRPLFQEFYERWWRAAAEAGDFETAAKAVADLDRHASSAEYSWRYAQQAEYRILRWRKARAAGNKEEGRRFLTEAAANYFAFLDLPAVRKLLREEWTAAELVAQGDDLVKKRNPEGALSFFQAAAPEQGAPAPELAERIEKALVGCARAAAVQGAKIVDFAQLDKAEQLFSDLVFQTPSFRAKRDDWQSACRDLMKVEVEYARLLMENDRFADAEKKLETATRRVAVTLWLADWEKPGSDPWSGVPKEVVERVDRRAPGADEAKRRESLKKLAERGDYIVPQAEPARAMLAQVHERKALADVREALEQLEREEERALDLLRPVLRKYPGSEAAEKAKEGLQLRIHQAYELVTLLRNTEDRHGSQRLQQEFTRMSDLLGFYVAEFGPPPPDDHYREELKGSLSSAADLCKADAPLQRVFLLSLLADALPDDPAGVAARKEAMDKGIELMATVPSQPLQAPAQKVPSLMRGLSVLAIENKTRYHLMVFLSGPEKFYVRLGPVRRGSVVVTDGTYVQAVIVASEHVRPFRGEAAYASETQFTGYYIARTGGGARPAPEADEAVQATGDYALLRTPEGGRFFIDPDSGMVMQARGK